MKISTIEAYQTHALKTLKALTDASGLDADKIEARTQAAVALFNVAAVHRHNLEHGPQMAPVEKLPSS